MNTKVLIMYTYKKGYNNIMLETCYKMTGSSHKSLVLSAPACYTLFAVFSLKES